jgi:hypothetical protein
MNPFAVLVGMIVERSMKIKTSECHIFKSIKPLLQSF